MIQYLVYHTMLFRINIHFLIRVGKVATAFPLETFLSKRLIQYFLHAGVGSRFDRGKTVSNMKTVLFAGYTIVIVDTEVDGVQKALCKLFPGICGTDNDCKFAAAQVPADFVFRNAVLQNLA